jgi:hypothetical protein
VSDDIPDIRQTIARCRRLANVTSDGQVAAGLRQMADDLEHSLDGGAAKPPPDNRDRE